MRCSGNTEGTAKITFHGATPILPVRDLTVSIDYFVKKLGFQVDFEGPGL